MLVLAPRMALGGAEPRRAGRGWRSGNCGFLTLWYCYWVAQAQGEDSMPEKQSAFFSLLVAAWIILGHQQVDCSLCLFTLYTRTLMWKYSIIVTYCHSFTSMPPFICNMYSMRERKLKWIYSFCLKKFGMMTTNNRFFFCLGSWLYKLPVVTAPVGRQCLVSRVKVADPCWGTLYIRHIFSCQK